MANRQALLGSNISTVKSHNLRAILLALLRHEYVSRVRLAELTGLSTTTITNLVTELLEQGVVVEDGSEKLERRRGAGRPRTALKLVPEARYAIGVHIGVGSVRVGITDLRARLLSHLALDHPLNTTPEEVLGEVSALVEQIIAQTSVDPQNVVGVGVGASGLVNPYTGVNLVAPNLGWHDVPIRGWLTDHLRVPVCIDNNVRAMALGEALFGTGQGVQALAFVYARVGLGAGFVVDGRLYRGSGAGAGEIGHTTIVPNGGETCRCGNTGCLETLVSEPTIVCLAEQLARRNEDGILATHLQREGDPKIERVFDAARSGDEETRAMLDERARYMGIALANLINTFNPELILLGGIFVQGRDLLLPAVEATMRRRSFADLGKHVRLATTGFGRQVGIIGAAALALNAFFFQNMELV